MKSFLFKSVVLSSLLTSACVFEGSFVGNGPGPYRGEQDACGFTVDEYSGQGLRWKKSKFPVVFKIHENVPIEAERNFISAVDHWNLSWYDYLEIKGLAPFDLFYVDRRGVYEGQTAADGSNLFLFVHQNFSQYENVNSQAITALRSDRRASIIDTDILVNNENFSFYYDSSYNTMIDLAKRDFEKQRRLASLKTPGRFFQIKESLKSFFNIFLKLFKKPKQIRQIADYKPSIPRNKVDFPSLIVHELGHVPGRGHFHEHEFHAHSSERASRDRNSETKQRSESHSHEHVSVMEPILQRGRDRREITEYDLENLFCAYYNY